MAPKKVMSPYKPNRWVLGLGIKIYVTLFLLFLILFFRSSYFHGFPISDGPWMATPVPITTLMPLTRTVELSIDHFNETDTRTFKNRYWMNDSFYEPGGPVFLYDGGEAGLSDRAVAQMFSGDIVFSPMELARRHRGILIIWEHRFFGRSMPFEANDTTGYVKGGFDAYQYLTNEQALEDVVVFARNFKPSRYGYGSLSSSSNPWIAMGGSYAGVRAAMLRVRNPEVFFASWSSSGPVQTRVENPGYWNTIIQSMPQNCSADVHAAVNYADEVMLHGADQDIALLKRALFLTNNVTVGASQDMFNAPRYGQSEDLTYINVASILATVFHSFPTFQSVGYKSLDKFCNLLETWNPENATKFTLDSPLSVLEENTFDATPTVDGVRAKHGPETAFYAFISGTIGSSKVPAGSPSRQIGSMSDKVSWTWMLCNQFAQFQVSQYPSPTSIISRFNNITSHIEIFCHGNFPNLPKMPRVSGVLKYGGWNMKPSNVMFTNGEKDPWRALGIQSSQDIQPDAPNRKTTQAIPACNVPPPGDEVFGIVHVGAVHVSDMRRRKQDPKDNVDKALDLFSEALNTWLPCFRPKT